MMTPSFVYRDSSGTTISGNDAWRVVSDTIEASMGRLVAQSTTPFNVTYAATDSSIAYAGLKSMSKYVKSLTMKRPASADVWHISGQYSTSDGTATPTSFAWPTMWIDSESTATSSYCRYGDIPAQSPVDEFRERIRQNLRPEILVKNRDIWGVALTDEEARARSLLFDLVGEAEFRRYLRRGFIMVAGRSGTFYKISGGHSLVTSYVRNDQGGYEPYERFCVQFAQYNLPFTDGVIMRKLLVENDEFALRKASNVHRVLTQPRTAVA